MAATTWTGRKLTRMAPKPGAPKDYIQVRLPLALSLSLIEAGYGFYDVEVIEEGILLRPRREQTRNGGVLPDWEGQ